MLGRSLLIVLFSSGFVSGAGEFTFFESKIRPILEDHCLKCHSEEKKVKGGLLLDRKAGWEEGGDSGPVIVPGKPDESLLIQMVRHESDVEAMPPKSKLSDVQIGHLSEWIKMGAPDPRDEALGQKLNDTGFDLEERKKWWSLQPAKRVKIPEVGNQGWARMELDRFILAGLEDKGWSPAAEADRVTLLRRASLVLTGLAPTPDELDRFLADDDEGAYERAVDRMMASSHFGENWARHWMDVVRYGESKAFEQDYWMPHTWQYRDYLIRAFNDDVPYDQFVREALAGDLLERPRVNPESGHNESVIGTGYLHLADGHHGVTDLHEDEARVIDSMINVVGTAFHGLTISCARCHDHKFDAITDEDYYSLYGMFRSSRLHYANVAETNWSDEKDHALRSAQGDVLKAALKYAEANLGDLDGVIAEVRKLAEDKGLVDSWRKLDPRNAEAREKAEEDLKKIATPEAVRWFVVLFSRDTRPELTGMRHLFDQSNPAPRKSEVLPAKTWLVDGAGIESAGVGQYFVNPGNPNLIQGAAGAGMVAGHLSARLDGTARSQDFVTTGEPVKIWVKGKGATVSLVIRNYELVGHGPTTGPLRKSVNSEHWQLFQFPTSLWKDEIAFIQVQHQGEIKRVRPSGAGANSYSDEAWVAVTTEVPDWGVVWKNGSSIEEVVKALLQGPGDGAEAEVLGALFATGLLSPDLSNPGLKAALEEFKEQREAIEKPVYVRSLVEGTNMDERVYIRGNHKRPSDEENPRRFLAGLNGEAMAGRGSGRREWAEQLLKPGNPLTARVRVNRIWSRVFGTGIVASVDDFGKMGEQPSHPELLDYLAHDFVKEKWSIKAMIRKMVLSSTFRMSSVPSAEAAQLDPKNTFLQRMPVRRMSAESIRDHILTASGDLKRDLYGPSIPAYIKDQPNSRAKPREGPLGGYGRRSVYLASRRNYLPSLLRTFDAPNTTEPVGKRNVTTVPAQSLALLNHPLIHQQSKSWADKILKSDDSDEDKLREVHRVAFSREATEEEIKWGLAALEKLGLAQNPGEAWASLCHIIINRKEFIYVF